MTREINEAIAAGQAGMNCDLESWQKVVVRFGRAYGVRTRFESDPQSGYQVLNGRFYTSTMQFSIAPESIISTEAVGSETLCDCFSVDTVKDIIRLWAKQRSRKMCQPLTDSISSIYPPQNQFI